VKNIFNFNFLTFLCVVQPHHKGLFLLDLICEQLDIQEKDYFGLRFVDPLKQRVRFYFPIYPNFDFNHCERLMEFKFLILCAFILRETNPFLLWKNIMRIMWIDNISHLFVLLFVKYH